MFDQRRTPTGEDQAAAGGAIFWLSKALYGWPVDRPIGGQLRR